MTEPARPWTDEDLKIIAQFVATAKVDIPFGCDPLLATKRWLATVAALQAEVEAQRKRADKFSEDWSKEAGANLLLGTENAALRRAIAGQDNVLHKDTCSWRRGIGEGSRACDCGAVDAFTRPASPPEAK